MPNNKEMEGDNRQRRAARAARAAGREPSEEGVTLGGSKQRAEASESMSHQQRIDLMRRARRTISRQNRPGSRDSGTPDRET